MNFPAKLTPTERLVADSIEQNGDCYVIKMTAVGNPDFLVIPKEVASRLSFVEVKAGGDKIRKRQEEVQLRLHTAGFTVNVAHVTADSKILTEAVQLENCQQCGRPAIKSLLVEWSVNGAPSGRRWCKSCLNVKPTPLPTPLPTTPSPKPRIHNRPLLQVTKDTKLADMQAQMRARYARPAPDVISSTPACAH